MSVYHISLVALTSTTLLILLLRPLAVATGLVDIPNERKSHQIPTPLVGGLAIFAGLAVAYLLTVAEGVTLPIREILSFFGGGLLLVTVGVVDDFFDLSPLARFAAQIVAALLMIFGAGIVLNDLGGMTLSGQLLTMGVLAVPFTVFATLGVINALNMCDGLDGLSGSLSLVSLAGLFFAAYLWGNVADVILLPLLGSAVVGFLLFNLRLPGRERASIFMGDAGSMFLGFALTWYAVSLSQGESRVISPAAALWFLMLPIFDTVTMMLRRILRGRSPFSPDREHLHHVFLLAGYTVNETVGLMASIAALGVLIGLASVHWHLPELVVAGGFLLVGLGYFWMIMRAWRVMRFLHHSICRRRITGDRRRGQDPGYAGPERRSGVNRRLVSSQAPELPSVKVSSPVRAPAMAAQQPATSGISSASPASATALIRAATRN